jgi:hypothetical protein
MASKLQKLRLQAFRDQQGRCIYCSQPIWQDDVETFAKTYGIRKNVSRHLRCTAEHLQARCERGPDARTNIAAACLWCNSQRHRGKPGQALAPDVHRAKVRALVAQGKWHPVAASLAALKRVNRDPNEGSRPP